MSNNQMSSSRKRTVAQGLEDLGLGVSSFASCDTRDSEFRILKKHYHKQCLQNHPDKGGDAAKFQVLNTAWMLLRDLHQDSVQRNGSTAWRFADCFAATDTNSSSTHCATSNAPAGKFDEEEAFDMSAYDVDWSNMPTPSWEYYQQAEEEEVPLYRVELAKSGRSKCRHNEKCKVASEKRFCRSTDLVSLDNETSSFQLIEKGDIRTGWLDPKSGKYGGWRHLKCWRVPSKIWLGLPDPDISRDPEQFAKALCHMELSILEGFAELPAEKQMTFVQHVMDKKTNWARKTKQKHQQTLTVPLQSVPGIITRPKETPVDVTEDCTDMVAKVAFVTPRPGVNGASDASVFKGKRFCLTGTFPEIGGGGSLDAGKGRVKAMLESFGGKVTGTVSGVTDVLVVGKDPGMSKVSKARKGKKNGDPILLCYLSDLKEGLDQGLEALEDFAAAKREKALFIESFSGGYQKRSGFNGKALTASTEEMLIAQGLVPKVESARAIEDSSVKKRPALKDAPDETKPAAKKKTRKGKKSSATADGRLSAASICLDDSNAIMESKKCDAVVIEIDDTKPTFEMEPSIPERAQKMPVDPSSTPPMCSKYTNTRMESKKPSAVLKDIEVNETRPVTTKKRTTRKNAHVDGLTNQKRLALKDVSVNEVKQTKAVAVVAKRKPNKSKKAADKKKQNKLVGKLDGYIDDAEETYDIVCDACNVKCTDRSWFIAAIEQDYCSKCYDLKKEALGFGAVLQQNGINVDASAIGSGG